MNSRERVLAALRREEPDQVPYCELRIDRPLAQRIMGWGKPTSEARERESNDYSLTEAKAIASFLGMDNISYILRPPVYAQMHEAADGRIFYGDGMIKSEQDLAMLRLPDPHDDALYAEALAFAQNKGDYAAWLVTRVGIFPTMTSMGLEGFSIALRENRPLLETVLDRYSGWAAVVAERICQLGFDLFFSTDDMAYKTGPFFSPQVFREIVLPHYRRVAEKVTIPWIVHSDGNILPFLDDLVELGIAGLHPIEKGAMDIRAIKARYGERLCLLGNVDLNILTLGSPEDVRAEVRALIHDVGPGGGYIVTSGNSLASYVKPENAIALSEAVREYGRYPLATH